MTIIERVYIGRFRGVNDVTLNQLGDINFIVGGNHSGKTSVLDAICWLLDPGKLINRCAHGLQQTEGNIPTMRRSGFIPCSRNDGIVVEATVSNVEHSMSLYGEVKSTGSDDAECFEGILTRDSVPTKIDDQTDVSVVMSSISSALRIVYPVTETSLPKPVLTMRCFKKALLPVIKIYDSNIADIHIRWRDGEPQLEVEYQTPHNRVLLDLCSYDLRCIVALTAQIVYSNGGVLLRDDILTSIPVAMYGMLLELCKKLNVQLIATTHDYNLINAVTHASATETGLNIVVHKLEKSSVV